MTKREEAFDDALRRHRGRMVSYCITCKGRLHHLRQTLPRNIVDAESYPFVEFVLLDYNSNDGLSDWVQSEMASHLESGRVAYYREDSKTYFNMSHAKNIAHRLARGDIVCNLDADNYIGTGLTEHIISELDPYVPVLSRVYLRTGRIRNRGARGRIALFRRDFIDVLGGYDENMSFGWGWEDIDFRRRLAYLRYRTLWIHEQWTECVEHSMADRVANSRVRSAGVSNARHAGIHNGKLLARDAKANQGRVWGFAKLRRNHADVITSVPSAEVDAIKQAQGLRSMLAAKRRGSSTVVASTKAWPVWTYWEGNAPAYIKACLDSLRRWWGVNVLGRRDFDALWNDDRDIAIDELHVAHRADYVRAYLLRRYGGIWVDADCLAVQPVDRLVAQLEPKHEMAVYREEGELIANNLIIARKDSLAIRHYYDLICDKLRQKDKKLRWHDIGSWPLEQAATLFAESVCFIPRVEIASLPWNAMERLVDTNRTAVELWREEVVRQGADSSVRPACFMLANQRVPNAIKGMSWVDTVVGPTLLSDMVRLSRVGYDAASQMSRGEMYWNGVGSDWERFIETRARRHPSYLIAEIILPEIVRLLSPKTVLDFGCGTGRMLKRLANEESMTCYGYDVSASMLEPLRGWMTCDAIGKRIRVGRLGERLPFNDGMFDVVFTCDVLTHVSPDLVQWTLGELLRVAKRAIVHLERPGGGQVDEAWHGGCWGHDLEWQYSLQNVKCRKLGPISSLQVAYIVDRTASATECVWPGALIAACSDLDQHLERGFRDRRAPRLA